MFLNTTWTHLDCSELQGDDRDCGLPKHDPLLPYGTFARGVWTPHIDHTHTQASYFCKAFMAYMNPANHQTPDWPISWMFAESLKYELCVNAAAAAYTHLSVVVLRGAIVMSWRCSEVHSARPAKRWRSGSAVNAVACARCVMKCIRISSCQWGVSHLWYNTAKIHTIKAT